MSPPRWRGGALVAVAVLHVLFTIVVGAQPFAGRVPWTALRPGVGSAQPPDVVLLMLCWSTMFGVALLLLGLAVDGIERSGGSVPRSVAGGLLALAVVGAVVMPVSGFWLVLPSAIALLRRP